MLSNIHLKIIKKAVSLLVVPKWILTSEISICLYENEKKLNGLPTTSSFVLQIKPFIDLDFFLQILSRCQGSLFNIITMYYMY